MQTPDRGGHVREDVLALDDGSKQSLTKMDFARAIHEEAPQFQGVDFEGFRRTFEIISEVVVRMVGT